MTGQELKEKVQSTGITITELARRMGSTLQNISYIWKAGNVKMGTIDRVAQALGVESAWLLGIESPEREEALRAELRKKDLEIARLNARIDKLLAIIDKS